MLFCSATQPVSKAACLTLPPASPHAPAALQDKVQQLEGELADTRQALEEAQQQREAALAAESAALEQQQAAAAAQAAAEERALQHAEERERAEQEASKARVDAQT